MAVFSYLRAFQNATPAGFLAQAPGGGRPARFRRLIAPPATS